MQKSKHSTTSDMQKRRIQIVSVNTTEWQIRELALILLDVLLRLEKLERIHEEPKQLTCLEAKKYYEMVCQNV